MLLRPIRVTEVLNYFQPPELVEWKLRVGKREANRISKEAMRIGTVVDIAIKEFYLQGKDAVSYEGKRNHNIDNCITAFNKWAEVYEPNGVIVGERFTFPYRGYDVSGEPDLIVGDTLLDIKCSSTINDKYWLQVNTYAQFLKHIPLTKVAILRLDKKTGSFEYEIKPLDYSLFTVWDNLLMAYVYFNREMINDDSN